MENIFSKMFYAVSHKDFVGMDIKIMIWFLFETARQWFAFLSDERPCELVDSYQRVVGT